MMLTEVWKEAYPLISANINSESIHVWPFDALVPAETVQLAFDDRPVQANRHDYQELIYIQSGHFQLQVGTLDRIVGPGSLVVMGANRLHHIRRAPGAGSSPARQMALFFRRDLIESGEYPEDTICLAPFWALPDDAASVLSTEETLPNEIKEMMEEIATCRTKYGPESRLGTRALVHHILWRLLNHYHLRGLLREVSAQCLRTLDRFQPLWDHLERHLGEPIDLERAASLVGLKRPGFTRQFRAATGQSFVEYITRLRVARARAELVESEETVARIALRTGFSNPSYFTSVFRRLVGVSPQKYRIRAHRTVLTGQDGSGEEPRILAHGRREDLGSGSVPDPRIHPGSERG